MYEGRMYVFGGWTGEQRLADLYCLDLQRWRWEQLACLGDPPSPREGHSAVVYQGQMIVFGGQAEESDGGDCYAFSFRDRQWSTLHTSGPGPGVRWPDNRFYHSAVVYRDDMYVFGGCDDETCYADVLVLHFPSLQWRHLRTIGIGPEARYCHSAVLYYDSMVVYGGCTDDANFRDFHELCLATGEWKPVCHRSGGCPPARFGHSASVDSIGNFMVLFGGCVESHKYSDVYVFTFDLGAWYTVECSPAPTAIAGHSAVYDNGRVITFGGCGERDTIRDVFELRLQHSWLLDRHSTVGAVYAAMSVAPDSLTDPRFTTEDEDEDDDIGISDSDSQEGDVDTDSTWSRSQHSSSEGRENVPCSAVTPRSPGGFDDPQPRASPSGPTTLEDIKALLETHWQEERRMWISRVRELTEQLAPQQQWTSQVSMDLKQLQLQVSEVIGLQRRLTSQLERMAERLDSLENAAGQKRKRDGEV
eukprot:GGOE01040919.1.p1 GENE.GGOE01040919.1~~GGOE01040919.1.p1  ORF type:complete len:533 (-),score=143.79 GGOE01040919.1:245-1666(-)